MAPPAAKRKNHKFKVKVRDPNMKKRRHRRGETAMQLYQLPTDLLAGEILSSLNLADRVRFGATCKKNHSLITNDDKNDTRRAIDELPWLVTFNDLDSDLKLYDPLHRRPYATYGFKYPEEERFKDTLNSVKASKNGWLLFLWPIGSFWKSFLLFSPFNRRLFKLPDLCDGNVPPDGKTPYGTTWVPCRHKEETMATFSSDPSSPDCVYFVLTQNVIPGKVFISTLHQNNNTSSSSWGWKTLEFCTVIGTIASVAYHDGCLYCVSRSNLAAYDPVQETWTRIISSSPLVSTNPEFCRRFYILECDGKLLLVCRDTEFYHLLREKKKKNGTTANDEIKDQCSLFELDSSTKTWVEKTSLGDRAIFIPNREFLTSFAVSVPWCSDIANKIFYYCSKYSKYYSFEDGKSYRCTRTCSYWSSVIPFGIWIQPPAGCITQTPPPP